MTSISWSKCYFIIPVLIINITRVSYIFNTVLYFSVSMFYANLNLLIVVLYYTGPSSFWSLKCLSCFKVSKISTTSYRELKLRIWPGVLCCVALKFFVKFITLLKRKVVGDVVMMKYGTIILSMLHKRGTEREKTIKIWAPIYFALKFWNVFILSVKFLLC